MASFRRALIEGSYLAIRDYQREDLMLWGHKFGNAARKGSKTEPKFGFICAG